MNYSKKTSGKSVIPRQEDCLAAWPVKFFSSIEQDRFYSSMQGFFYVYVALVTQVSAYLHM